MKALVSTKVGGPGTLVLQEVPIPEPGKGQLGIRVQACGINYPDVLVIEDKYQSKPPRPFAPGCEIAGTVETLGEDTSGWHSGDRIVAVIPFGGLSEQVVVAAENAFLLPDGKDPIEGAGLILTYATTLHALADRGELKSGETLLVLGAAGGVGLAAIEIGKVIGAHVVGGVSSEEKASIAREAGADEVFVYERGPFDKVSAKALAQTIKSAVGSDGAHVIYDPVGGAYTEAALRSISWAGRYLVIGFTAGIPGPPLNLALLKSADIRGCSGALSLRVTRSKMRTTFSNFCRGGGLDVSDHGSIGSTPLPKADRPSQDSPRDWQWAKSWSVLQAIDASENNR